MRLRSLGVKSGYRQCVPLTPPRSARAPAQAAGVRGEGGRAEERPDARAHRGGLGAGGDEGLGPQSEENSSRTGAKTSTSVVGARAWTKCGASPGMR